MIKAIVALLITLTPARAEAKPAVGYPICTPECVQLKMDGMGQCANLAQIFTPGSKEYNNMWYACIFKLQKTEKYKQCQSACEPKAKNETTTR